MEAFPTNYGIKFKITVRYKVTIMRNKVAIARVRIMSHKVTLCDIKQYVDNIDAVERFEVTF